MHVRPLVMKFGGTSVADAGAITRLVSHVAAARTSGPVVVVVSALARVTDQLLALLAAARAGDAATAAHGISELRARHDTVAREVGATSHVRQRIGSSLDDVEAVLRAVATLRDASPRTTDAVLATGELISSRIVHAALAAARVSSNWVDARRVIVTDDRHTQATPVEGETGEAVAREIASRLAAGHVPVMGGFIAATRDGATATLGRGGSDYSAAIVGAALDASEIQIWTDVDGMLTADPRVIDRPQLVGGLSYGEAFELAYFGAKVLHPSTILPAVARGIPVRILNSRRADTGGTLIDARGDRARPLAAVACKRNVTVIDITSTRMLAAYGFLRRLFEVFERLQTSVDVVSTSEVSVSVTLDDDARLDDICAALREFAEVRIERGNAILCGVGDRLAEDGRVAARLLAALGEFPLRMVSQAASRRNVTVVLRDDDLPRAMHRVHDAFFADVAVADAVAS